MKINILLFFLINVYYVNAQLKLVPKLGGIVEDVNVTCPNIESTVDKCLAIVYTKKNKGITYIHNLEEYLNCSDEICIPKLPAPSYNITMENTSKFLVICSAIGRINYRKNCIFTEKGKNKGLYLPGTDIFNFHGENKKQL